MDGVATQMVLPVLGIAAAAAVTFYVVSFSEIREKSFKDLDESDDENPGLPSRRSREIRARRKAAKENKL